MNTIEIVRCQGLSWALSRAWLVAKQRTGFFKRTLPCASWPQNPVGRLQNIPLLPGTSALPCESSVAVAKAERILAGQQEYFSKHRISCGFPPDWFLNPFDPSPRRVPDMRHWSSIGDFGEGDIKGLWETARFGWVFPLARAYAHTEDDKYAEGFWRAVEAWRAVNFPQCGVHWKCGQEIALRVMAWIFGFCVFQESPSTTPVRRSFLAQMLEVFAKRIDANIGYALSQHNNHGVSEAAGLFTIGVALGNKRWIVKGRGLLERLAQELIYDDGSFSQHSTNYHRLMLHDYLWVIRLAQTINQPFSERLVRRVGQAGKWLLAMLDPVTGRAPNLGSNDGTHIFDLTDLGYLDYRPTVQAIGWITERRRWLAPGPWDELAFWLAGMTQESRQTDESCQGTLAVQADGWTLLVDGGYALWRNGRTLAMLRCPARFRHRPAHADILHLDLWHEGRNLLCDGGTYSYNCEATWQGYFPSVAAHNTIQFDDHDQMPRLSRFLYGRWPRVYIEHLDQQTMEARYRDWRDCSHCRRIRPNTDNVVIEDTVDGFQKQAVLRWRLNSGLAWTLQGNRCTSSAADIHVTSDTPIGLRLTQGWESLYYWEKTEIQVLEAAISAEIKPVKIMTRVTLRRP
jgi:hypothetical protein